MRAENTSAPARELDEQAFDRAKARWHERYLSAFGKGAPQVGTEQAHDEAVDEALEEFLGAYERERAR